MDGDGLRANDPSIVFLGVGELLVGDGVVPDLPDEVEVPLEILLHLLMAAFPPHLWDFQGVMGLGEPKVQRAKIVEGNELVSSLTEQLPSVKSLRT